MTRVFIEDVIYAERAALFELMHDCRRILQWDSCAKRIRYDGGRMTSSRRVVRLFSWLNLFSVVAEHVCLVSPALSITSMTKGPFFLSECRVSWYFTQLPHNKTAVKIDYQFKLTYCVLGWILNPLIARLLQRDCRIVLGDLKHAAEETDLLSKARTVRHDDSTAQCDFFHSASVYS